MNIHDVRSLKSTAVAQEEANSGAPVRLCGSLKDFVASYKEKEECAIGVVSKWNLLVFFALVSL